MEDPHHSVLPEGDVRAAALANVAAKAAVAGAARAASRQANEDLRGAVLDADKVRAGRNRIADAAEPGMARRLVFEAFGAFDILSRAQEALRNKGDDVSVRRAGGKVFLEILPSIDFGPEPGADGYPQEEDPEEERRHAASERVRLENLIGAIAWSLREQGLRMAAPPDDLYDLLTVQYKDVEIVKMAGTDLGQRLEQTAEDPGESGRA